MKQKQENNMVKANEDTTKNSMPTKGTKQIWEQIGESLREMIRSDFILIKEMV